MHLGKLAPAAIVLAAFTVCATGVRAQGKIKTEYRFWLSLKGPELVFRVALDKDNVPKSVSMYRPGEATPFQTMQNCAYSSVEWFPADRYPDLELLRTADFNFDGYQDLMLVGYANSPHLGNTFYCVWLWEPQEGKFKVLPGAGDISDPTPDPETKTIRSHRDYIGGPEVDEVYAWEKGALVLVERRRREYSSAVEGCGEYVVETRKNGAMVKVRDDIVEPGVDEIVPCKSAKKLP